MGEKRGEFGLGEGGQVVAALTDLIALPGLLTLVLLPHAGVPRCP